MVNQSLARPAPNDARKSHFLEITFKVQDFDMHLFGSGMYIEGLKDR